MKEDSSERYQNQNDKVPQLSLGRRSFVKSIAALGAGLAASPLLPETAQARDTGCSDYPTGTRATQSSGMYLTSEENRALNGEYGPLQEWAMKFLTKWGGAFDAERLIEITGAFGGGPTQEMAILNPAAYAEIMKKEYKFPIPICTHYPGFGDRQFPLETGNEPVPPEQLRRDAEMGIFCTGTCAPYLAGWDPPFRSHVASLESSCIVYLNSVLGVRTHRYTFPSYLASFVMGKTPYFGLHTDEGRKGKLLVKVETKLANSSDYSALGWFTGSKAGIDVPVITGIPSGGVSQYEHMSLGAAMASTGGVGMYHMVGSTPEATTIEQAFGNNKPEETFTFGPDELKKTYEDMMVPGSKEVDCVVLGCPHLSITEMMKVAELVEGKKVNEAGKVLAPGSTGYHLAGGDDGNSRHHPGGWRAYCGRMLFPDEPPGA